MRMIGRSHTYFVRNSCRLRAVYRAAGQCPRSDTHPAERTRRGVDQNSMRRESERLYTAVSFCEFGFPESQSRSLLSRVSASGPSRPAKSACSAYTPFRRANSRSVSKSCETTVWRSQARQRLRYTGTRSSQQLWEGAVFSVAGVALGR